MNIPKTIQLAGITITIEQGDHLKEKSMIGEARYAEQKILLDFNIAPEETTAQAFMHEKIHYALFIMNEDELRNNEKFVDVLAHLLYQAESSAKGIAYEKTNN